MEFKQQGGSGAGQLKPVPAERQKNKRQLQQWRPEPLLTVRRRQQWQQGAQWRRLAVHWPLHGIEVKGGGGYEHHSRGNSFRGGPHQYGGGGARGFAGRGGAAGRGGYRY